jgi:hypothetical protein
MARLFRANAVYKRFLQWGNWFVRDLNYIFYNVYGEKFSVAHFFYQEDNICKRRSRKFFPGPGKKGIIFFF